MWNFRLTIYLYFQVILNAGINLIMTNTKLLEDLQIPATIVLHAVYTALVYIF